MGLVQEGMWLSPGQISFIVCIRTPHTPGGFPNVFSLYARGQIIYDNRPDEGANAYYGLEGMHEGVSNADQ